MNYGHKIYLLQYLLSLVWFTLTHDVRAVCFLVLIFGCWSFFKEGGIDRALFWKMLLFHFGVGILVWAIVGFYDRKYDRQLADVAGKSSAILNGVVVNCTKQGQYDFEDEKGRSWVLKSKRAFEIGQIIGISGKIKPVDLSKRSAFGSFNYDRWLKMKGYVGTIIEMRKYELSADKVNGSKTDTKKPWQIVRMKYLLAVRKWMANRIQEIFGSEQEAGLLYGMLLGSKSGISQEQYDNFIQSGLVHLIAVSGGNMVMVSLLLSYLLFWLPYYVRLGCIACGIVFYAVLCGGDSSVIRAVVMGLLSIVSLYAGKAVDSLRLVTITMILMLICNPYYLVYDMGFVLSFGAVFGLIVVSRRRTNLRETKQLEFWRLTQQGSQGKRSLWQKIGVRVGKVLQHGIQDYVLPTIGATLGVLPILIIFSGQYNLTSIIGNFIVNPLVGLITIGGLLALMSNVHIPFVVFVIKYLLALIYLLSDRIIAHGFVLSSDNRIGRLIIVSIFLYILLQCYKTTMFQSDNIEALKHGNDDAS